LRKSAFPAAEEERRWTTSAEDGGGGWKGVCLRSPSLALAAATSRAHLSLSAQEIPLPTAEGEIDEI